METISFDLKKSLADLAQFDQAAALLETSGIFIKGWNWKRYD